MKIVGFVQVDALRNHKLNGANLVVWPNYVEHSFQITLDLNYFDVSLTGSEYFLSISPKASSKTVTDMEL